MLNGQIHSLNIDTNIIICLRHVAFVLNPVMLVYELHKLIEFELLLEYQIMEDEIFII